jgi:VanZ family protein
MRRVPWLFWAAVLAVAVLSVIPGETVPPVFRFWDKAQHALAFAVLAVGGLLAYGRNWRALLLALGAYGALIELVQTQLPWRFGDVADFAADVVGLAVGIVVFRVLVAVRVGAH